VEEVPVDEENHKKVLSYLSKNVEKCTPTRGMV